MREQKEKSNSNTALFELENRTKESVEHSNLRFNYDFHLGCNIGQFEMQRTNDATIFQCNQKYQGLESEWSEQVLILPRTIHWASPQYNSRKLHIHRYRYTHTHTQTKI